jgi:hypothetical protein
MSLQGTLNSYWPLLDNVRVTQPPTLFLLGAGIRGLSA